jgi:hypothetical protein
MDKREHAGMRSRGYWVGWILTVCIVAVSVVTFVDTAHPVTAAGEPQGKVTCPTGASGMPGTCAELHAAALASGAMSRASFELAQARLAALSAHAVTP